MLEQGKLDKTTPIPLYYQLKKLILEEITNGSYPVGAAIPTENELSEMFGISRTTVRQAIVELVQEGRLYRVKSKGTFVARPKIQQQIFHRYESFNQDVLARGGSPGTEVLALKTVDMPEELARLRNEKGKKAVYLSRLRSADGEPMYRNESYFPLADYAFLLEVDFTRARLYEVLADHPALRVERLSHKIEAVPADAGDAGVLRVKRGSPILLFTTVGYNREGLAVEYGFARYRGDGNSFRIDLLNHYPDAPAESAKNAHRDAPE